MAYIEGGDGKAAADECPFCRAIAQGPSGYRKAHVLCSVDQAFVLMNKYPYNNGHVLVLPTEHVADPMAMPDDAHHALTELVRRAVPAIQRVLGAHGVNIGMNLGAGAGAGIPEHCHFHIVPRFHGDTNFMPVIADTRVMGEHIDATYERLLPEFAKLGQGPSS